MVDWRNTRCWVMSQLLQLLKVYVAQVMIVAAPSAQKPKSLCVSLGRADWLRAGSGVTAFVGKRLRGNFWLLVTMVEVWMVIVPLSNHEL